MQVWAGNATLYVNGKPVGTCSEITLVSAEDIERAQEIARTTFMSYDEALDLLKAARLIQDKLARTAERFDLSIESARLKELARREARHFKALAHAAVEHQRGAQWKNEPKAYGPKKRR